MNMQSKEKVVLEKIKRNLAKQIQTLENRISDYKSEASWFYDNADPEDSETIGCFTLLNDLRNKIRKNQKKLKSLQEQQRLIKKLIRGEVGTNQKDV